VIIFLTIVSNVSKVILSKRIRIPE